MQISVAKISEWMELAKDTKCGWYFEAFNWNWISLQVPIYIYILLSFSPSHIPVSFICTIPLSVA